eukprot:6194292-Pleurochrysis_carterae.AAC.1
MGLPVRAFQCGCAASRYGSGMMRPSMCNGVKASYILVLTSSMHYSAFWQTHGSSVMRSGPPPGSTTDEEPSSRNAAKNKARASCPWPLVSVGFDV